VSILDKLEYRILILAKCFKMHISSFPCEDIDDCSHSKICEAFNMMVEYGKEHAPIQAKGLSGGS